tara:strand:- start:8056 stop:9747 length:1692 start_codon:yes stop_codon:yes gene_type:complete
MEHNISLITTLAAGLGLGLLLGLFAFRLKLPPLVGYLVAGIIIGPHTPGYVADAEIAAQLSEIGVMLLMFGVGLHFSLKDLLAVRRIALPGAIVQMLVATLLGMMLTQLWGWSIGSGLIFGLTLSVASTVVLLKALEARGALSSLNGNIAVGWLVVEDLAMVFILVLIPPVADWLSGNVPAASNIQLWQSLGLTLLGVTAFIVFMLIVGRRALPWLLWQVARSGSRELFTLCVIAAAIGIAFASSKLFGVSFALGAFFAGMVMRESEYSHRAAEESLPLRDAFSVLFFVSVGMLFDPLILLEKPVQVLGVILIIVIGKSIAAALLLLLFKYPLSTALTVSASLAQIGEFSFILVGLSVSLGLIPVEGQSLVLAGALISIALNPLLFSLIDPLHNWVISKSALARRLESRIDPLSSLPMSTEEQYLKGQVVLVGFGSIGSRIATAMQTSKVPFVVAEQNRELVEELREQGIAAVSGDATEPETLVQAHIANAGALIIAIPDAISAPQIVKTARLLNGKLEIMIRSTHQEEAEWLSNENLGKIFYDKEELAKGMIQHILNRYGKT